MRLFLLLALQQPGAQYRHDSSFALPDTLATPGAVAVVDTAVLCQQHTATVRAVTAAMHRAVFRAYGIPWARHARYEDDHAVPLELGGANANANRWPQPLAQARVKDRVENWAHRQVCRGTLALEWVQGWMARDWVVLLRYQAAHP